MSKRYFPQQYGDRKKPRLDVSVSDHNFPLSQNIAGPSKVEPDQANTWGDDQDDEILLLASQACEDVYNTDSSFLPDYSICMKPGTTSTQLCEPSTSNASSSNFSFKKPNALPLNVLSTNLRDKCNGISSPLPGISSKLTTSKTDHQNFTDDLIFNDKIFQGQDVDVIYRQLVSLQEENAKLKSENGKLLEKCVTKEGESSILRTQLKSCQISVDNARLEKIKAQEKVQMEWSDKLQVANNQMHDLRTQLEFKNLEIISVKEKVRLLESNKIRLTQVTVPANDITSSQRRNATLPFEPAPRRVVPTNGAAIQTDNATELRLNKIVPKAQNPLTNLLPRIIEPTPKTTHLSQNETLQRQDTQTIKCRVYSTFHRIPASDISDRKSFNKVCYEEFCKDLTVISTGDFREENLRNIVNTAGYALEQVEHDLQEISNKMTNAFQKEMDEKYIEYSTQIHTVSNIDLLNGRALFTEEQAILPRRIVAILPHVFRTSEDVNVLRCHTENSGRCVLEIVQRICTLLDATSCALLYSGLLLSITNLLQHISINYRTTSEQQKTIVEILKNIISSRPMSFVCGRVLGFLRKLIGVWNLVDQLCPGGDVGNLRLDYDQGVLLFKKDSCYFQVLLKQIEAALQCIEKQALCCEALEVTQNTVLFYANVQGCHKENRCDCQMVLLQVMVYALRICAYMAIQRTPDTNAPTHSLLSVCRTGIQLLYQCTLKDAEFSSRLGHNEGHFMHFVECMRRENHTELYATMLSELSSTFQCPPEDIATYSREPWLKSFECFAITDH